MDDFIDTMDRKIEKVQWKNIDGTEYFLHVGKKSYAEARVYCKNVGGKLMEPKSPQVNAIVQFIVNSLGLRANWWVWIGIHDIHDEKNFVYDSDGKQISWRNFSPGQPDNYGRREHCVHVWHGKGKWNDYPCEKKLSFACERGR